MSRRSQRKGADYERKVAEWLREALNDGSVVKRTPQNATGHGLPDVTAPGIHVETKHRQNPKVRAALRQAVEDAEQCGGARWPVAVVRFDSGGPGQPREDIAVMRLDDWLELYSQWHAETK